MASTMALVGVERAVSSRVKAIPPVVVPSSKMMSSAAEMVMSLPAPFEVREIVVPEMVMASPPSPKVTIPLASSVPAKVPALAFKLPEESK